MRVRATHTYAIMEVSDATFDEVRTILEAAGYDDMLEREDSPEGRRVVGLMLQNICLSRKAENVEEKHQRISRDPRTAVGTALTYLTSEPPMVQSAIDRLREVCDG